MRVHHLALRTHELPRLRAFYIDLLGLRAVRENAGRGVWLDAGGAIVMLEAAEPGEPGVPAGTLELTAFAIEASARPGWVERLERAGVAIEARTEHTLYFRDPDGRRVALSSYPL